MCGFARMRLYACLHAVAALTCQRASECRHVYTHFRIIVAALTCLLVRECRHDFGTNLVAVAALTCFLASECRYVRTKQLQCILVVSPNGKSFNCFLCIRCSELHVVISFISSSLAHHFQKCCSHQWCKHTLE